MQAEHIECILLQFSFCEIGTFCVFRDFFFYVFLAKQQNVA